MMNTILGKSRNLLEFNLLLMMNIVLDSGLEKYKYQKENIYFCWIYRNTNFPRKFNVLCDFNRASNSGTRYFLVCLLSITISNAGIQSVRSMCMICTYCLVYKYSSEFNTFSVLCKYIHFK
jgi:hypothetical protein